MAHGLTSKDTMFSVRERPWHGLGAVLKKRPKTIKEALKLAKLDWTVSKEPLYIKPNGRYAEIDGHFAVIRSDDGSVLGTVTDRYELVQNVEAFEFLDAILGEMIFETAGSLWGGRRVWALVRLPEHIMVGGDAVDQYALVTTTHDATGAVIVAVTPIRVVCNNTLTWALNTAQRTYSVRHLANASRRLYEARASLGITVDYYKQFAKLGNRLASQRITERKFAKVLEELYPKQEGMGDRAIRNQEQRRLAVMAIFKGEGPHPETVGNAPGSKWCAANAIVEYQDWFRDVRGDESEGRFMRHIDDPESIKAKGFKLVAAA